MRKSHHEKHVLLKVIMDTHSEPWQIPCQNRTGHNLWRILNYHTVFVNFKMKNDLVDVYHFNASPNIWLKCTEWADVRHPQCLLQLVCAWLYARVACLCFIKQVFCLTVIFFPWQSVCQRGSGPAPVTRRSHTHIMITTAGRRDGGLSIIICQSITGNPVDSVRDQRVYRNNNYINTCINVNKLICINCCVVLRCCQTARLTMAAIVPTRSADVRRCMCVICLVLFFPFCAALI